MWHHAVFYLCPPPRQTTNDLTGEHSCIMLSLLGGDDSSDDFSGNRGGSVWLREFFVDFRRRFTNLLSYQFRTFAPALALGLLQNKAVKVPQKCKLQVLFHFSFPAMVCGK